MSTTILWDISHGAFSPDYIPSTSGGYYEAFADSLAAAGHNIQTTDTGFTPATLASADIAVLCAATAKETDYSADEINALTSFVNSGGGLLIMGDYDPFNNYSYTNVAEAFNLSFGATFFTAPTTSNFVSHPVTDGISSVYMYYGLDIAPSGDAQGIIFTEDDQLTLAATAIYGSGKVIAVSDSSLWSITSSEDYFSVADNEQFAHNVFNYLGQPIPEPATMLLLLSGSIILRRRK
jgi:hypothetical protein